MESDMKQLLTLLMIGLLAPFAATADLVATMAVVEHEDRGSKAAEPFDLAAAIRDAGIDAVLNDDQYVYLR